MNIIRNKSEQAIQFAAEQDMDNYRNHACLVLGIFGTKMSKQSILYLSQMELRIISEPFYMNIDIF